uniref:Uncharacterized protein n=1 Tax=Solanum tuberosum TaxID=4113 RepID=M1E1A2_SOLTU
MRQHLCWEPGLAKREADHSASFVEFADQLGNPPFGRAQHTGTKGEDKTFWRFTEWVRQFSDLHLFVLSAAFVLFC